MKEEVKIEELNGMALLKLIYEEIKDTREEFNIKLNKLNEKIDTVYKELNEKIDTKFNYLDEKIADTKNSLVAEVSEELRDFFEMLEKRTNNLNKKMDNEIEDRKMDISKIKEFNRIIINDIRSRVSILEEESEKYNLK